MFVIWYRTKFNWMSVIFGFARWLIDISTEWSVKCTGSNLNIVRLQIETSDVIEVMIHVSSWCYSTFNATCVFVLSSDSLTSIAISCIISPYTRALSVWKLNVPFLDFISSLLPTVLHPFKYFTWVYSFRFLLTASRFVIYNAIGTSSRVHVNICN